MSRSVVRASQVLMTTDGVRLHIVPPVAPNLNPETDSTSVDTGGGRDFTNVKDELDEEEIETDYAFGEATPDADEDDATDDVEGEDVTMRKRILQMTSHYLLHLGWLISLPEYSILSSSLCSRSIRECAFWRPRTTFFHAVLVLWTYFTATDHTWLMQFREDEVVWNPYRKDVVELVPTRFHGMLHADKCVEPYMQDRVMRQLGWVQTTPQCVKS